MPAVTQIRSRTVVLPTTNIDTDQIIPARFLTATSKAGFGKHLFADWRYDAQGNPKPDFALNAPEARGAGILVAGGLVMWLDQAWPDLVVGMLVAAIAVKGGIEILRSASDEGKDGSP